MKKRKGKLTPKLRFPEFRDRPYHSVRLGDVAEEAKERNEKMLDADAVMGVFKGQGMLPMEQRLVAKDLSRYKVVEKYYFAYNPMRLNIGSIARWHGDESALVSPDYVVFRCLDDSDQNLDPDYLDQFRCSGQWDRFVRLAGDGSVRVRIYFRDLATLRLILPSTAEQQKIAECLSSLDGLIAAEGRKLEALKAHKKGLMQQLFPQPGETQPQVRFPAFRGKPGWKQRNLVKLTDKLRDGDWIESKDQSIQGIRIIQTGNIGEGVFIFKPDKARYISSDTFARLNCSEVFPGDCLVSRLPDPIGKCCLIPDIGNRMVTAVDCAIIRFDSTRMLPYFFVAYSQIKNYLQEADALGSGSTRKRISRENLSRIKVPLPELNEQQKVADSLAALDNQITAQTAKIESLKQHKRGLMQQLFPAPDEH